MKKIFIALIFAFILATPAATNAAQSSLPRKLAGRILLQVQAGGRAWYVNPADEKKYLLFNARLGFKLLLNLAQNNLNKPGAIGAIKNNAGSFWYVNPTDKKRYLIAEASDLLALIKKVSLGINNKNLQVLATGINTDGAPKLSDNLPTGSLPPVISDGAGVINQAAQAIRSDDKKKTLSYFTQAARKAVAYTMNFLNAEAKLALANILAGAKLTGSTETEKIYTNQAYFSLGGYKVPVNFHVKKQTDGTWLMTNL